MKGSKLKALSYIQTDFIWINTLIFNFLTQINIVEKKKRNYMKLATCFAI